MAQAKKSVSQKHTKKKPMISSLLSVMTIVSGIIGFIGLALNWNLFLVIGGLLIILTVGILVIFLPGVFQKLYKLLYLKIDKTIDNKINEFKNSK